MTRFDGMVPEQGENLRLVAELARSRRTRDHPGFLKPEKFAASRLLLMESFGCSRCSRLPSSYKLVLIAGFPDDSILSSLTSLLPPLVLNKQQALRNTISNIRFPVSNDHTFLGPLDGSNDQDGASAGCGVALLSLF